MPDEQIKNTLDEIFKYLPMREKLPLSIRGTVIRMVNTFLGCLTAHQLIYLTLTPSNKDLRGFVSKLKLNYFSTRRLIQYSTIAFNTKILVDAAAYHFDFYGTEYEKGGIAGLITYLVNRPLDQMQKVKQVLLQNQKKSINRLQATRIILKWDGWRGFYKHQNFLGPINSILYRSIYFGFYHRMCNQNQHILNLYLFFPLLTSFVASLSTFLLDKTRNLYLRAHDMRGRIPERTRGKRAIYEKTVTQQLLELFGRGQIKIEKNELMRTGVSITKNWILLSAFAVSQTWDYLKGRLDGMLGKARERPQQ